VTGEPLFSQSNPASFHDEQLSFVVVHGRVSFQIRQKPFHDEACDLRVVPHLKADNTVEPGGRIRDNIPKITIKREQNCAEFPGLRNDGRVCGLDGKTILETQDLMSGLSQSVNDEC
jgi:hypothetical protein